MAPFQILRFQNSCAIDVITAFLRRKTLLAPWRRLLAGEGESSKNQVIYRHNRKDAVVTRSNASVSSAVTRCRKNKNRKKHHHKKKPNTTPFHQPHLLRTRIPFYGSPREKLAAVTSSRLPFKEARNFKDVIDPRDVSARHAKETHPSTRTPSADVREWRGRTGTSTAGVAYLTSPLWEEHATGKLETYVADSCYVNY